MMNKLLEVCVMLLLAATAIYVAVRLIESVTAALVIIAAVAGGLIVAGLAVRILWRFRQMNRW